MTMINRTLDSLEDATMAHSVCLSMKIIGKGPDQHALLTLLHTQKTTMQRASGSAAARRIHMSCFPRAAMLKKLLEYLHAL